MELLDQQRVRAFFKKTIRSSDGPLPKCLAVTHLLADRPFFLEALAKVSHVAAILPKPKTVNYKTKGWLQHRFPLYTLNRSSFADPKHVIELIRSTTDGAPFVLLDIGAYFSTTAHAIKREFDDRFIGIIEDTENGIQKYEALSKLQCAVYHVARSPLKRPEDFLVGQSIVFSTEALLRERGDILHGRTACVIGYGKLGRSIANLLHNRHVKTVIYDVSPITSVEALSHGFTVAKNIIDALKDAGLVFCASGRISLKSDDYKHIQNGAYVATVTSSDDELEGLSSLAQEYELTFISEHIARYRATNHTFYILNRGQAVNFLHGAAVGPFIYLVQAEILAAVQQLWDLRPKPGIYELHHSDRERIASAWYAEFGSSDPRTT